VLPGGGPREAIAKSVLVVVVVAKLACAEVVL
jgi:hypothetical protein